MAPRGVEPAIINKTSIEIKIYICDACIVMSIIIYDI